MGTYFGSCKAWEAPPSESFQQVPMMQAKGSNSRSPGTNGEGGLGQNPLLSVPRPFAPRHLGLGLRIRGKSCGS